MKQHALCVLSLLLIGCGNSPVETTDQAQNLPQVPPAPQEQVPNDKDAQQDKPRIYNETGALPSTRADWERVGVPQFSSANLSNEELEQVIRAAQQKLEQEKVSKSTTPADTSGSTSALNALKGKTGVDAAQLRVNGVAGLQMDLGLPVYVQLKGDVDSSKTTDGVTGLVAYRFGNTAVGAIQSYANESNAHHTETYLVAAQSLRNMYIEGQLGTVSFEGGSGMRSQVRLGVDTSYGMPFVQLTHRDFGALSDTAAYVGLEVSALELKASDYTFSTQLITKTGHHSVNGNIGAIEGSAKLSFSHGLSVDTQISFGSNTSSKLSLNVAFEQ